MEQPPFDDRRCTVCGTPLHADHLYCPNCGTRAEPSSPEPDPSTIETRETPVSVSPPLSDPGPQQFGSEPPAPPVDPAYQESGQPTWGTPATIVPPEKGNRTLWIIIGIVVAIILFCCCMFLALMAIASMDTAFQDELQSASSFFRS